MYKTDIEIAQSVKLVPVEQIAQKLGIDADSLDLYGKYKAKINVNDLKQNKKGKLILVTAITPTPYGEGKTTTTVGLGDALNKIGKSVVIALREPSLGPVFGIKGGAAGGGYAQVVPMEDLNLHFTGDFHAIGAANNLLAAMLDNHIHQGNALKIDTRRITWRRCVDMNDRQLRNIVNGLGGKNNGVPREDGFDITVASEIMAVLCLAENITDLKNKLGSIIVGYNTDGEPVTCSQLKAQGAMTALLADAIRPNLVQTLEHTPVIIHGGPFANIAHGCNSVIATKTALRLADFVVTEAGFGADLGAEKFLNIKCRKAGLTPDAVVIVATLRALKHQGGASKEQLATQCDDNLRAGIANLTRHIENINKVFNLPAVVAINRFATDLDAEIELLTKLCKEAGANVVCSEVWGKGGLGGEALAHEVVRLCGQKNNFSFAYSDEMSIKQKVEAVVKRIYRGSAVQFLPPALAEIANIEKNPQFKLLPVCMAKTQYSFSDDATKLGAPTDFTVTVKNVKLCAGAGFIVCYLGDILTMPGLPKVPAAENIDIDEQGKISGLF